jgi:succinoglycan biosynthesis protein ExoM
VIVDNDSDCSGKPIVEEFESKNTIPVLYCNEPVQNIALARNMALEKSQGNCVAFIDDDETPIEEWLLLLHETMCSYKVAGVLGPVLPCFQEQPSAWVVRSKLCERKRFCTGTYVESAIHTRTGNILLSKAFLDTHSFRFDRKFGLTGGEDCDLFGRMMEKGAEFVWCDEACVYEAVPSSRLTRKYMLKRALLRGVANSQGVHLFSKSVGRSVLALICYASALPVLIVAGHHNFMRFLVKSCDHLGKVLAVIGIKMSVKRQM